MIYISLGSNVGDRLNNLETALLKMGQEGLQVLKISPVYETPALLPPFAPAQWNQDFLNAVCQVQVESPIHPEALLKMLKNIEKIVGRKPAPRWSPRVIDLDILLFEDHIINTPHLTVPHPALLKRNFVLAPLKDINPLLKVPTPSHSGCQETVLSAFRKLPIAPLPALMQIVNITPDSFSDGSKTSLNSFKKLLLNFHKKPIAFLDLGAESTRPGAKPLSPTEEWQRLKPYLDLFKDFYTLPKGDNSYVAPEKKATFEHTFKSEENSSAPVIKPRLSIDTRHAKTAEKALSYGIDLINDVSGLARGEDMLQLLQQHTHMDYVLTHSLTVPADRGHTLALDKDPVEEIKKWLEEKINLLERNHISLSRVIFDPGIGFGKTAEQSLEILKRIREFYIFPLRIMVGHSRKSFMQGFAPTLPEQRDLESIGVSLKLSLAGVDILRVHNADLHARALRAFML